MARRPAQPASTPVPLSKHRGWDSLVPHPETRVYPLPAFEALARPPVWVYERAREWLSMGVVREGAAHPRIPATAQQRAIDASRHRFTDEGAGCPPAVGS